MFRFRRFLTPLLVVAVVAVVAWPVYASCKKCRTEAQEMMSVMESSSLSLTSAIAAADGSRKSQIVAQCGARCTPAGDWLRRGSSCSNGSSGCRIVD